MSRATFAVVALLTLSAATGCHKKPKGDALAISDVADALASAGLHTQDLKSTDAARFGAQKCLAGPLEGVDALVCEFATPDAAASGKPAGEQWVGNASTAAVLGNGRTLLAVADRAHADPHGRAIHKITHAYMHLK